MCFGHLEPRKEPHKKWCCTCFWWTEILLCWNIILSVGQWDKNNLSGASFEPSLQCLTIQGRNKWPEWLETNPQPPKRALWRGPSPAQKKCVTSIGIHDIPLVFPLPCYKVPFLFVGGKLSSKKILEMESFLRCANLGSVRPPSQFFEGIQREKDALERRLNSNSQKQLYVNDEMYTYIYNYIYVRILYHAHIYIYIFHTTSFLIIDPSKKYQAKILATSPPSETMEDHHGIGSWFHCLSASLQSCHPSSSHSCTRDRMTPWQTTSVL